MKSVFAFCFGVLVAGVSATASGSTLSVFSNFDHTAGNGTSSVTLVSFDLSGVATKTAFVESDIDTNVGILSVSLADSVLGYPVPQGNISVSQDGGPVTILSQNSGQLLVEAVLQGAVVHKFDFTVSGVSSDYDLIVKLTAVPVPAAVWLFGTAIVGLGVVARRRRQF